MEIISSRSDTMKKLFLYISLFGMAFWSGYLISHEKYKDYHYDYDLIDVSEKNQDESIKKTLSDIDGDNLFQKTDMVLCLDSAGNAFVCYLKFFRELCFEIMRN